MKSDKSIKNICIAAIKRHTIPPYDFSLTTFFEKEAGHEVDSDRLGLFNVAESELPISMTSIDTDNFTVVTTRQIITCQNGIIRSADPNDIVSWKWNDFKGHADNPFTRGKLILNDKQVLEVFIETGKASMVMIYAIRTLIGLLSDKADRSG